MNSAPLRLVCHRFCRPLAAAIVTMLAACLDPLASDGTNLPRPLSQAEVELVRADNAFALKVFRAIADSAGPDSNLFISPLSASMALAMAYNGAGGTTQVEMQHALAVEGMTLDDVNKSNRSLIALLRGLDSRVVFNLANSVWYRQGFTLLPGVLCISEVRHEASVDVNEEGTEATAATSVGVSWHSEPPTFVVDHPFVFVIRERFSGTILFMGRVMKPTAT